MIIIYIHNVLRKCFYRYKGFLFKHLFLILICYVMVSCGDPYKFLYGSWKICAYRPVAALGCFDKKEANKMVKYFIDKEFILQKDYMIINGIKYNHPIYELIEEDADAYFFRSYITHKDIFGIKENTDKVKILKIYVGDREEVTMDVDFTWSKCVRLAFTEMVYYNNEIIFSIEPTVYFYLKKIK